MPFENQHAARVQPPGRFDPDSYRTTAGGKLFGGRLKVPSTINVIWAKLIGKSAPSDPPILQSLRFKTKYWTLARAKAWLKKHNVKYRLLEKATGTAKQEEREALLKTMAEGMYVMIPIREATADEKAQFEEEGICLLNEGIEIDVYLEEN